MPKRVAILQSNYIPWKGYFDIIHDVDEFIFHDDLQYTKQDWRNRNYIKTASGPAWLTIPVGDREDRLICEVELPATDWSCEHWRRIEAAYASAPYFETYRPFLEEIFLRRNWLHLSELNQYTIRAIAQELGIGTRFRDSRELALQGRKQDRVLEILKQVEADVYVSGPAGRGYLDQERFDQAGIELRWKNYDGYPEYPQFHPPFVHEVTVLDLLFHTGNEAWRSISGLAMIELTLFVTGTQRSGTTLLEKLLAAQRGISMLSQPFPLLFTETKRTFLGDGDPYPLGHLFLDKRYDSTAFARFLRHWRTSRDELEVLFARMQSYSGQYTRFDATQLDAAFSTITADDDFAAVISRLDHSLARKRGALWFGSKETICEEYTPPLLDRGFRCAIILRDPRDVVASLNHGRGREFGGDLKPTLFNIRSWRKSVAVALAMSAHPHFHYCRYEDLIIDPKHELDRVAAAFELGNLVVPDEIRDDDGTPWRGNSSHGEHHGIGTSSVAMWRQVLPPEVAALIEAACLPELQVLGYETSITRAEAVRVIARFREPYTITRTGMESDRYSAANAAMEIERLERVSDEQDEESARWFLYPDAHALLRGGFQP